MIYVIIVAAGTGNRFGSDIPKQFLPLGVEGRPVLMHTVAAFLRAGVRTDNIRIALSEEMFGFWEELCRKNDFVSPQCVEGGETRFYSVRNALESIDCEPDATIMVHDGVRPLVDASLIERMIEYAQSNEAVVPGVPVTDSLRYVEAEKVSRHVDRSNYVAVQTPQTFRAEVLKEAYNQEYRPVFTDDASVVESCGVKIVVAPGSRDNIKITTPFDFLIAETLMKK